MKYLVAAMVIVQFAALSVWFTVLGMVMRRRG